MSHFIGQRVITTRAIERFDSFLLRPGMTGVIVAYDQRARFVAVRLDELVPPAAEWDNEVQWNFQEFAEFWHDVRLLKELKPFRMRRCECCDHPLQHAIRAFRDTYPYLGLHYAMQSLLAELEDWESEQRGDVWVPMNLPATEGRVNE